MRSEIAFLIAAVALFAITLLTYHFISKTTKKLVSAKDIKKNGFLSRHPFFSKLYTVSYISWWNIDRKTIWLKICALLFIYALLLFIVAVIGFIINLYYIL